MYQLVSCFRDIVANLGYLFSGFPGGFGGLVESLGGMSDGLVCHVIGMSAKPVGLVSESLCQLVVGSFDFLVEFVDESRGQRVIVAVRDLDQQSMWLDVDFQRRAEVERFAVAVESVVAYGEYLDVLHFLCFHEELQLVEVSSHEGDA